MRGVDCGCRFRRGLRVRCGVRGRFGRGFGRGLRGGSGIFAGIDQAKVGGVHAHKLDVLVAAGLVEEAPGAVSEGVKGRVSHVAALEDRAVVPGETVVVGDADCAVSASTGGVGVGEEQDTGACGPLGGVRECADDGGVVPRVSQVPVVAEGTPGLTTVVGDSLQALACGALRARVEEQATVGEFDDLVLVRTAFGGGAGFPGRSVVVGVDGDGHEGGGAEVGDGVLLDEASGVGAVA